MACCSTTTTSCTNPCGCRSGKGYLIVIVLYILLAIIVGSFMC